MSAEPAAGPAGRGVAARAASAVGRSRELTLTGVMVLLCLVVAFQAPDFLSLSNMSQVTTLAAIIAIAAVVRPWSSSQETWTCRSSRRSASSPSWSPTSCARRPCRCRRVARRGRLGLRAGMANGGDIYLLRVPSLVAPSGTTEHLPRARLSSWRGHEVNLADPAGRVLGRVCDPGVSSACRSS